MLDLGVRIAVPHARTVCYVEREIPACAILAARMGDGLLDPAPVWLDLATFDGRPWRGAVDCIVAGFPCQPWSVAGDKRGINDSRWIWDDIGRIIRDVRPGYVFLENVPGLVSGGGVRYVLGTLAECGFAAEWDLFSAAEAGAPHERQRWFCLAYHAEWERSHVGDWQSPTRWERENRGHGSELAYSELSGRGESAVSGGRAGGRENGYRETTGGAGVVGETLAHAAQFGERESDHAECPESRGDTRSHIGRSSNDREQMAHPCRESLAAECTLPQHGNTSLPPARCAGGRIWPPGPHDRAAWADVLREDPDLAPAIESPVRRVVDGHSVGVDRLHALGNGCVPVVAAIAFRTLLRRLRGG